MKRIQPSSRAMADIEKPRLRQLNRVLPISWLIKFQRSVHQKPQSTSNDAQLDSPEPINTADSAPFRRRLWKMHRTQENAYSQDLPESSLTVDGHESSSSGPYPEHCLHCAFAKSKSFVLLDANNATTSGRAVTHARRDSFSVFSWDTYRSAISSLGNLCSAVGGEPLNGIGSPKHVVQKARPTATLRFFLFAGCGGIFSRNRQTRPRSMESNQKSGLMEPNLNTGLECPEGHDLGEEASRRQHKYESWLGDGPRTMSSDLIDGEVVKCLGDDVRSSPEKPPKFPTLGELFSEASETDDMPMISQQSDVEEFDDPGPAASWSSSKSSFTSGRELGGRLVDKKPWNVVECENALVTYSGDSMDRTNISDSQSLLRAKVIAAESFRKQHQLEKRKEEEAKKLLASLDRALDQYNLKRLIEGEYPNVKNANFGLDSSPVFESFLESSAKAWGIDFPPPRMEEHSKTSDSIRELHCVTAPSPIAFGKEDKRVLGRGGNARDTLHNTSLSGEIRKAKRSVEEESPKKRSCASSREDRIHHPQGEEHTAKVSRLQTDESNSRRRRLNDPRKQTKQRRLKQVPSGAHTSGSPQTPRPGCVVKDSIAVAVESSYNPYSDFRNSMIEMIVDQNIQQAADLEELLQCYLALNEPEYHTIIVEVFTDVWHELFESSA